MSSRRVQINRYGMHPHLEGVDCSWRCSSLPQTRRAPTVRRFRHVPWLRGPIEFTVTVHVEFRLETHFSGLCHAGNKLAKARQITVTLAKRKEFWGLCRGLGLPPLPKTARRLDFALLIGAYA